LDDPSAYFGLTTSRLWHAAKAVSAAVNFGARIGTDARAGGFGRIGVEIRTNFTAFAGDFGVSRVMGDLGQYTTYDWTVRQASFGAVYRTPDRFYGILSAGISRVWVSVTGPDYDLDRTADSGTWTAGLGMGVGRGMSVEVEYQSITQFDIDGVGDRGGARSIMSGDAVQGVHLTLLVRPWAP